jgi:hypothetical protein
LRVLVTELVCLHQFFERLGRRIELLGGWSFGAMLDISVHQALIAGQELVVIVVIRVTGEAVQPADPERIGLVGVVLEQRVGQAVDRGRIRPGMEWRRLLPVEGDRVDAEVAVERAVLGIEDHQIFDRRRGREALGRAIRGRVGLAEHRAQAGDQGPARPSNPIHVSFLCRVRPICLAPQAIG